MLQTFSRFFRGTPKADPEPISKAPEALTDGAVATYREALYKGAPQDELIDMHAEAAEDVAGISAVTGVIVA